MRRDVTGVSEAAKAAREAERLTALRRYAVLDTDAEAAFDRLTALAADLFDAPMALVSLIDEDRQWFKSAVGLPQGDQTPRREAFCDYVVAGEAGGVMVIPDATADPRLRDYPAVVGDPHVRFYAGAALTTADGHNLGSLCVIDDKPRPPLSERDLGRLRKLAQMVVDELELRRATALAEQRQAELDLAEEIAGIGHWRMDLVENNLTWSPGAFRIYGLEPTDTVDFATASRMLHPEDREQSRLDGARAVATGQGYESRTRITRPDGEVRITDGRTVCELGPDGKVVALFGVRVDVTEQVKSAEAIEAARSAAVEHARLADAAEKLAGLGHWRMDVATSALEWSEQMYRIFGMDPSIPLDYAALAAMTHEEDSEAAQSRLARLLAGGGAEDAVSRILRPSGEVRWLQSRSGSERDADGRVVAIMGTVMDVTERREAEDALADSEARYRTLAENTTDILIRFGRDGLIRYISPACRVLGVDPDEAIGRSIINLVAPEHIDHSEAIIANLFTGAEVDDTVRRQHRIIDHHGREIWLEGSPKLVRDERGEVVEVVTVMRDVTQRRRMEAELADKERHYRLITNASRDVVLKYGIDGVIRYASVAAGQLGYEPKALVGMNCADLMHPDDVETGAQQLAALHARAATDEPGEPREYRILRADGAYVWFEGNPTLVRGEDGKPAYVNSLRDITIRKATQAALAESEARYRSLADAAPDMICETGLDYVVRYVSPASRAMFGLEPHALMNRYAFEGRSKEEEALGLAALRDIIDSHGVAIIEPILFRSRHTDGRLVWVESRPAPIFDEHTGAVIGFIDILRDVTARVQLEEALRAARAEAEAAAAVKSEFLANMSHELRTPLTAVLGFTRLALEQPDLSETTRGQIRKASNAGAALLTTVNDILDFSKLEAGQLEVRPRPTDVREAVAEALDMFGAAASEKGLGLILTLQPDLPDSLSFDPERVRQILLNLIGNAVKFSDAGAVTLSVGWRDERLSVSVADRGPGMSGDQQARLFQRFSQVDGSSTRRHGGTGLGLAICKGLVDAMGGEIGVESAPGQGSRFYFDIPAAAGSAREVAETAALPSIPPGLRVLVADDHAANRELVRQILAPLGAVISEAGNGREAVEVAAAAPLDAILMDLRMPELDGPAAMRAIRFSGGLNGNVPILAFSAGIDAAGAAQRLASGFDGDVAKPILAADLVGALATALWPPLLQPQDPALQDLAS